MYLVTPERLEKMKKILYTRQWTLRVFMDYVYSPHNLSAIVRTCDAVNVGKLYYRHQKKLNLIMKYQLELINGFLMNMLKI